MAAKGEDLKNVNETNVSILYCFLKHWNGCQLSWNLVTYLVYWTWSSNRLMICDKQLNTVMSPPSSPSHGNLFRMVLSPPPLINEGHLPSTSRTVWLWNAICKHSSLSRSIGIGSKDVSSNSTCNASSRHLLNGPWQPRILQIQRRWVLFAQFTRTPRSICYSSAARHYIYTVDNLAFS